MPQPESTDRGLDWDSHHSLPRWEVAPLAYKRRLNNSYTAAGRATLLLDLHRCLAAIACAGERSRLDFAAFAFPPLAAQDRNCSREYFLARV